MYSSDIKKMVSHSIATHSSSDTISKSELENILVDVLLQFGKSSELSDEVAKNISKKMKYSHPGSRTIRRV